MWQMVFANVLIEGWIVYPNVYSFFDQPDVVVLLSPHYGEIIIIYRYKCDRVECEDEYIGESARTFGERFKEHLKNPSPIHDHNTITGHDTTLDNFTIVGREEHNYIRLIKEAIYIRVNNPSLNKNIGKYHLPHVWDEVLNNITELKLK